MNDAFIFVITLLIFFGVGCFILGILLFQNIQRAYDRLNTHTHSIVNTTFPEWTLHSNEAVFEYNPVSSPPSLYLTVLDYFEKIRNEDTDWSHFTFRQQPGDPNKNLKTYPVGSYYFNCNKFPQHKLCFIVHDPIPISWLSGAGRHPFRIVVCGQYATEVLHSIMAAIDQTDRYKKREKKKTPTKKTNIIPFEKRG